MKQAFRIRVITLALSTAVSLAAAGSTPAQVPLAVESNESNGEQLAVARFEGDAVRQSWELERADLAGRAAEQPAGEYQLIVSLTKPEGWYMPDAGGLAWHDPPAAGSHLRVVVLDGADHRTVPGLEVYATVDGGPESPLPFGWYPLLNGYGANVSADPGQAHDVRIRIAPAVFRRHDPYNGDRFTDATTAEFAGLGAAGAGVGPLLSEIEERHQAGAGRQGGAMGRAVRAMHAQATSTSTQVVDDYRIEEAVEFAEAYWFFEGARFTYKSEAETSSAENCHVEIAPRDAASGRFLPGIPVTVTLLAEDGRSLGTEIEPFMWHPWLYHYGENWRVPHSGKRYRIQATFPAPTWRRYGRASGRRFAHGADVEFRNVAIKSGEK